MNILNYRQYNGGNINDKYVEYLEKNKAVFGVPANKTYVDDDQDMYEAFAADISISYKRQL